MEPYECVKPSTTFEYDALPAPGPLFPSALRLEREADVNAPEPTPDEPPIPEELLWRGIGER